MNVAYKYLFAGEDVLFIFFAVNEEIGDSTLLSHCMVENRQYLRLGKNMHVPLDGRLLDYLRTTSSILIGESEPDEFGIRFIGRITFDKVFLGKLLAYFELGKQQMEEQTHFKEVEAGNEVMSV